MASGCCFGVVCRVSQAPCSHLNLEFLGTGLISTSIIQIMLAVPTLDKKSLTLSAKFNDLGSKEPEDTKYMVPNSATTGSADMGAATRRGGTPGEEPRTMAEDLV